MAKFYCRQCNKYWTADHQPVIKNDRYQIVRDSLERSSIRILSRRYKTGKKQIMDTVHEVSSGLKSSTWIASHFPLNWSGTLVFDGKYIKTYDKLSKQLKTKRSKQEIQRMNKSVWLCGIDYGTGDLPHYDLADEETKIDLVMYFQNLKKIGYVLQVLVCDGNKHIPAAAKHVYGEDIIVQLCTRHFIENLKHHAGKTVDRPRVQKTINLIQFIIQAKDLEIAGRYLQQLKQIKRKTKVENELIDLFKKNAEKLTAHLLHPDLNIPHTSNDIENLFKQLNLRTKSISRFNHWRYARDYLKAWALLRRFTPFTDCRKHRRWRNGKAPIEIAGAKVKNVDCLRL